MKYQKTLILIVTLVLMAGTAGALAWLRANQKLGLPGVKGTAIPKSVMMDITLPERVLDFTSTNVPEPDVAIGYFPKDTSYTERAYFTPDGLRIQSTVILMGADRTSIHRPEYCLPGQGWTIEDKKLVKLPIADQPPYSLDIARWNLSISVDQPDGQKAKIAGVYAFWYVTKNEETADHDKMLEWLTLDLFRTGELQRWAYCSYFAACLPGQEEAAFEQIKRLITASVPQFELPLNTK
jgi:Protein of unknown function (DUF3485)